MGRKTELDRLREHASDEKYFELRDASFAKLNSAAPVRVTTDAEFVAIVKPLEDRAGGLLRGRGRLQCQRAFSEAPDGFRALVEEIDRKVLRNPLGYLIRTVEYGDHRLLQPSPPVAEGE